MGGSVHSSMPYNGTPSSMNSSQHDANYYRDHHDRRHLCGTRTSSPFSSARPPLDAPPNARSNYSHYGPNHPHDTTATNTTAATAAPPTAAPAPPSHVTRPMNAEGYSHTTSVPCKLP
ncbi:hypothetical protein BDF19DRAFT_445727 [Syncephalis fuscata]|nr:hypothetical protein BDF19DRAFT_445727 [Syncephalis fuscata]